MLHAFSGPFRMAITLWPFISALLTIPVLALFYHRCGRLTLSALVWSYLAVLYALGLGCFTLYPMPQGSSGLGITYGVAPQLNPFAFIGDIQKDGVRAVFQIVANVALFVPLGYMLCRGLQWRWLKVLLAGLAVSLLIETAQLTGFFGLYPYAYRTFDVDDLMSNTLGALVGLGFARLVGVIRPKSAYEVPPITYQPSFVRRCIAAIIDFRLCQICSLLVVGFYAALIYILERHGLVEMMGAQPQLTLASHGLSGYLPLAKADDIAWITFWICLVIFELLVPVTRGGSTLGGSFIRMSCETKKRKGAMRALFYGVRSLVFFCVFSPSIFEGAAMWIPLICILAYPFCHGMPYDLLPGSPQIPGVEQGV